MISPLRQSIKTYPKRKGTKRCLFFITIRFLHKQGVIRIPHLMRTCLCYFVKLDVLLVIGLICVRTNNVKLGIVVDEIGVAYVPNLALGNSIAVIGIKGRIPLVVE